MQTFGLLFVKFQRPLPVTCDIEQMFHSFFVNPEHRDFLRFLWFENNDLNRPIVEYRMNVHLFGAVSSPAVSNFGMRATAEKGRESCEEAARFLEKEFYVDDGLKSFDTPEQVITIIKESQEICSPVQLRLHKFASNSKKVLEALPPQDRAKTLKNLDLRHDTLPIQRSLGTYWCMELYTFGFRIELKDKPCTRRGILLSTISSVYDPLGIASPVILVGKQILQVMCRDNVDWDDPIPDEIYYRWQRWRSDLPLIERMKVSRCVKPPGFGEPVDVQVHSFSDASEKGLGQVSYLRLVDVLVQACYVMCFFCLPIHFAYSKPASRCELCRVCRQRRVAFLDRGRWGSGFDDLRVGIVNLDTSAVVTGMRIQVWGCDSVTTYHQPCFRLESLRIGCYERCPPPKPLPGRVDRVLNAANAVGSKCEHDFREVWETPSHTRPPAMFPMVEGMADGTDVYPVHLCAYCFHYPHSFEESGNFIGEETNPPCNVSVYNLEHII